MNADPPIAATVDAIATGATHQTCGGKGKSLFSWVHPTPVRTVVATSPTAAPQRWTSPRRSLKFCASTLLSAFGSTPAGAGPGAGFASSVLAAFCRCSAACGATIPITDRMTALSADVTPSDTPQDVVDLLRVEQLELVGSGRFPHCGVGGLERLDRVLLGGAPLRFGVSALERLLQLLADGDLPAQDPVGTHRAATMDFCQRSVKRALRCARARARDPR